MRLEGRRQRGREAGLGEIVPVVFESHGCVGGLAHPCPRT